ncbi:MAG: hypothetical protein WBH50_21305, partial [Fuerstiella sp.]
MNSETQQTFSHHLRLHSLCQVLADSAGCRLQDRKHISQSAFCLTTCFRKSRQFRQGAVYHMQRLSNHMEY